MWACFGKCTSTISPTPRISNFVADSQSHFRLVDHKCRSCFGHCHDVPALLSLCARQLLHSVLCLLKVPRNISQGNCLSCPGQSCCDFRGVLAQYLQWISMSCSHRTKKQTQFELMVMTYCICSKGKHFSIFYIN